jgi:hypothetical protein
VQLEPPQIFDGGGVGRAPEEGGQLANSADVGFLSLVLQLAHAHVLDHALAQRCTGANRSVHGPAPVDERGGLPRSSTSQNQRRNELPRTLANDYRVSGLVLCPFSEVGEGPLPSNVTGRNGSIAPSSDRF